MSKNLTDLRTALFETLEGLKTGAIDIDKAKMINEVGKTLVETAKVEVDFLRVTNGVESAFIEAAPEAPKLPNGITGITRHTLNG